MKRIHLRRCIVILPILAIAVIIASCKKDKLTEPDDVNYQNSNSDRMSEYIVNRIKRFDNQLKLIKQGSCRDDSSIAVDSALWNIESLFNATFSFPDRIYVEKRIQELSFKIDVDKDGFLKVHDVSDLYDDIIASVRDAYRNDGFSNDKSLMSIVIKKGNIISGELHFKLLLISGRTAKNQSNIEAEACGLFKADDCWYFGEYGGSCDDPNIVYDAAKALENIINFNYGNKLEESSGYRNLYVNMTNISLEGNEYWNDRLNDYYIYYKVNCPDSLLYLDYRELNKYLLNMCDVIFRIVPYDSKYSSVLTPTSDFIEVSMEGLFSIDGNNTICNHNTNILYGDKYVVSKLSIGSAVDLLK